MSRAVIVPGNDLDGEFYGPMVAALAQRGVAASALTLPGWAGVPPLPEPGWRGLVAWVREAAGRALAGGGTLIGHSLGALTALLVAAERPPEVRRLVLLEPIIAPARAIAAALAGAYLREVVLADRSRFLNGGTLFRRVHDLRRFPAAAIQRYLEVRRTSDRASAEAIFRGLAALYPLPVKEVVVPTLLVRGARSGVFARLAQAVLAGRLRRPRRAVLPCTGHWVANESDEAAAAAIAGFIGSTER